MQKFNVVNPSTLKVIGQKFRVDVHRDGSWHRAVNAFIYRLDNRTSQMEVLVQERSKLVDIGQELLDQSLATQQIVQDDGSNDRALYRGLSEELSITEAQVFNKKILLDSCNFYISKKYEYDPYLWNRECFVTYFIQLDPSVEFKLSSKVDKAYWVLWDDLVTLIRTNPKRFTKTARSLFVSDSVVSAMSDVLGLGANSVLSAPQCLFYYSGKNYDVLIEMIDGDYDVTLFDMRSSMIPVASAKLGISDIDLYSDSLGDFLYNLFNVSVLGGSL